MLHLINGLVDLFAVCLSWCIPVLQKNGAPMVEAFVDLRGGALSLNKIKMHEVKLDVVFEGVPAI